MGEGNVLFESIFNRKLSAADTREFLTRITKDHPYFSPAQFFLLLQTDTGTTDYRQQAIKTSILFNNPHWLQFQLQEKQQELVEIIYKEQLHGDKPEVFADDVKEPTIENITSDAPSAFSQENVPLDVVTSDTIDEAGNSFSSFQPVTDKVVLPETPPIKGLVHPDGTESKASPGIETGIIPDPGFSKEDNEAAEAPAILDLAEEKETSAKPGQVNGVYQSGFINENSSPLVNDGEPDDDSFTAEEESEPLNFRLNINKENTTEDKVTFEPLHTTDYFASLGIRLSSEIKYSDKLGKQLKSFTEWLKTMKKINPEELPIQDGHADISIQKLAEQSNREDVVVTEAMADVLHQQGKAGKAIELLEKLSLLNPSKSAYFAAKIDQLKEH